MNYKNEALRVMQEIANEQPNYTLGDVIFSCFQKVAVNNKQSLNFIREVEDEDLYTLVEKAQLIEHE